MQKPRKRLLGNWIKAYLEYTEHTEAPENFHLWTAIGTIAGALRRKVWFDMGTFTWTPNFYIVFVAPPGVVSKSTTSAIGLDLLKDVPGIVFGPSSTSWQAFIRYMAETCQVDYPLDDGDFFPMAAVTVEASELGSFVDFKNGDMAAVLCDLYDGKTGNWSKLSKTSGNDNIVNPWINLIACTTPSWIAEHCTDYFSGGGLASRIMFIYGENKRHLVAYPKRRMQNLGIDIEKRKKILLHDLEIIASLNGEFELSDEAYEWGEVWYKKHWTEEHPFLTGEKYQGYLARKQTHLHKTAMVYSAARSNDLLINVEDLVAANEQICALETNLLNVFALANKEDEATLAADVLDYISRVGKVRKQTLFREFFKVMTSDTFEKILKSLSMGGFVTFESNGNELNIIYVKSSEGQ